jgi:hypothetical protein
MKPQHAEDRPPPPACDHQSDGSGAAGPVAGREDVSSEQIADSVAIVDATTERGERGLGTSLTGLKAGLQLIALDLPNVETSPRQG